MTMTNENEGTESSTEVGGQVEPLGRLLALMDKATKLRDDEPERALWLLLKRYEKELPALDYYFHEAFRQVDVTDSALTDMAIWHLLHYSKVFWRLYEKVQGEKAP